MYKKNTKRIAILTALGIGIVMATVPMANAVVISSYQVVTARPAGSAYYGKGQLDSGHAMSGDGRYVVFTGDSLATDYVSNDMNNMSDVFVRDMTNSITRRVSVAADGTEANGSSSRASISYDGNYVVFESNATNLVGNSISSGTSHIYIKNLSTGSVSLIDQTASGVIGNNNAQSASVSADGKYVVFASRSTNLTGSGTFFSQQIYVKNTHNGAVKAVSATSAGTFGNDNSGVPDISCDGGIVAFSSSAPNLGVSTAASGRTDLILAHLSWDGSNETDNVTSYTTYGINANGFGSPQVSCDGNEALFTSASTNVVSPATPSDVSNVYQYNRLTSSMRQASLGSGDIQVTSGQVSHPQYASMSADGRYVAFTSFGTMTDLDPLHPRGSDTGSGYDVYIRDMKKSTTELATVAPSGQRAGWMMSTPAASMSADGSSLVFNYFTPRVDQPYSLKTLVPGYNTGQTYSSLDVYKVSTGY